MAIATGSYEEVGPQWAEKLLVGRLQEHSLALPLVVPQSVLQLVLRLDL